MFGSILLKTFPHYTPFTHLVRKYSKSFQILFTVPRQLNILNFLDFNKKNTIEKRLEEEIGTNTPVANITNLSIPDSIRGIFSLGNSAMIRDDVIYLRSYVPVSYQRRSHQRTPESTIPC